MKKYLSKLGLTVMLAILSMSANMYSQCTNDIWGQYPFGTITPTCIGSPFVIVNCAYTAEYSVLSLTAGTTYTFTSTVPTDFFTITDDATNTPQTSGTSPAVFVCGVSGLYRLYRHLSPLCDDDGGICRDVSVQCGTPPPPVTNDDCDDVTPAVLTNGAPPTILTGTTLGATSSTEELNVLGVGAVWEAVTLTGTCNQLTVSFCGTAPGTMDNYVFALYTDCPLTTYTQYTAAGGSLSWTACGGSDGNPTYTFNNLPPGTYYLPVLAEPGYNPTLGPYTMNVSSIDCPPPPINDDCTGAIQLNCGDMINANTEAANPDPTAPVCGGNTTSKGIWYTINGTGQTFTVSLCGSSYDTYLHLYSGSCGALTCINWNDDFCGLQSELTFPTTPGVTYYILANAYSAGSGPITINVTSTVPVNDACSSPTSITPGVTSGSTFCSTVDVTPAAGTASVPTAGGVWYTYTPGCSGNISASVCTGTTFNSQISVFSGACGSLTAVAGNNDFCGTQSSVGWAGVGGTTYRILVHGNGSEEGTFDLTLVQQDLTAPVPNVALLPTITSGCEVTLTAPTATDNCAGTVTGTTPIMTFSTAGTYNVTWTYNDGNGNTSTQPQQVVINDITAPASVLPNDTTLSADSAMCCATFLYNTSVVMAVNQLGVGFENGYTNNGLYSVADDIDVPAGANWNVTSMTFDAFSVTPLPSSIDIWFYSDGGGYPGSVIAMDNITPANYTATIVGSAFGFDDYHYVFNLTTPVSLPGGGSGTQYWVAVQCNGGGTPGPFWEISTSGAHGNDVVQVFGDLTTANWASPSLNPGADAVFSLTITDQVYFTDECNAPISVTQDAGPANGSCLPLGTTTVTYTATDQSGNSNTYSFNVTVVDDQAPVPDLDSSAAYSFTSTTLPAAIIDGGIITDSVLVSGVPNMLATGDIASVCIDIQHTYDGNLILSLISPQGTVYELSSGNGGSEDNYTSTCFDMSAPTNITSGPAPFVGSFVPEGGAGFQIFNGEDPNGYWKLMVEDAGTPDVGALMEFHMNFDFHWEDLLPSAHINCGSVVTPTASDNCGSTITGTTSDPTSFTDDGTYNVTWTYTDAAGNTTTQTQEVVVDDITPPVPTQAFIPPSSGSCSATAESIPTAIDACTGDTIDATTTDALTYNVAGTYTITWSYDDGNGNISTQTQTIIVTDIVDPVPSQPVLGNAIGNCSVTVTPPTAVDNCAGTITGTTTDPITYNVVGIFLITWTFDDGNGNIVTQNQTVVVNPCIGIEEESGEWSAMVYPNPGSGIFTLSLSVMPTENTQVRLVDALGQVLYTGVLQNQVQQFDFSHLASATYYLLITNNDGQMSKPVIIRQNY